MHLSMSYAILFGLAGFAAAAYFLRIGGGAKMVPIFALSACALYTLANYGFSYAMLTVIEFAIGFGIAHAVIKRDAASTEHDKPGP